MATPCTKCNGKGSLYGFSHIANGQCFRCMGTGEFLTLAEKAAIHQRRIDRQDAQMAREQGVSLETLRAYLAPAAYGTEVPKHPNGCSYSIQEFEAWREAA